ncbi:hypothetical protein ABPG77_007550 [Micractinium sp. CCAP 211/92]
MQQRRPPMRQAPSASYRCKASSTAGSLSPNQDRQQLAGRVARAHLRGQTAVWASCQQLGLLESRWLWALKCRHHSRRCWSRDLMALGCRQLNSHRNCSGTRHCHLRVAQAASRPASRLQHYAVGSACAGRSAGHRQPQRPQQEGHQQQQQQQQEVQLRGNAEAVQHAGNLLQQLATATTEAEVQAAAENAATWLATILPHPAALLIQQLVAKLLSSSSSLVCQPCGAAAVAAKLTPAAVDQQGSCEEPLAISKGVHQESQQCIAPHEDKASWERLNHDLNRQVSDHQQQLASLHLRLDNLLLERQQLQEEAHGAAAAQAEVARLQGQLSAAQAEVAQLRKQLSAAPAEVSAAQASPCRLAHSGGSVSSSMHSVLAQEDAAGRATFCSAVGSSHPQLAEQPSDDEVSWGRSLTARGPAARPTHVPPVDLSRMRGVLPGRK